MITKLTTKYYILEEKAKEPLKMTMTELWLSARAYNKILEVSRTIADSTESEIILAMQIAEAIQ